MKFTLFNCFINFKITMITYGLDFFHFVMQTVVIIVVVLLYQDELMIFRWTTNVNQLISGQSVYFTYFEYGTIRTQY